MQKIEIIEVVKCPTSRELHNHSTTNVITSLIQLTEWMDCTDVCILFWTYKGGGDNTTTWGKCGHTEGSEYW